MVSEDNQSIPWTDRKALPREWIDVPVPAVDVAGLPAAQDDHPLPRPYPDLKQGIPMLALLKDGNGGFVYGERRWKQDSEDESYRQRPVFVEMRHADMSEQQYPEVLTANASIGAAPLAVEKPYPFPGWRRPRFLLWGYDGRKVAWRMPEDTADSKQVSQAAVSGETYSQFAPIPIGMEAGANVSERRQWQV